MKGTGSKGHFEFVKHFSVKPWVSLALLGFVIAIAGCTSALKKQCQETNWFQHGYNLAMQGKLISADTFIPSCEREEVSVDSGQLDRGFKAGMDVYCKPETVFETGKDGQKLNLEFCDPGKEKLLRAKHAEGIAVFCRSSNGYTVGAGGRVYNQICPKDLEPGFLKEYGRGRKVYLNNTILSKEQEIVDWDNKVADLEKERNQKMFELAALPAAQVVTQNHVYDKNTGKTTTETTVGESQDVKQRRDSLKWDVDGINRRIEEARGHQRGLRSQILDLKRQRDAIE